MMMNVQTGAIKYEGKFYEFHIDDWESDAEPKKRDNVDFIPEDDGSCNKFRIGWCVSE